MKKKYKPLGDNNFRVIKISKDALFEFIYESFIDDQETFFDVDSLKVTDSFTMDYENGQFIFCVYNTEDKDGNVRMSLPKEIDIDQLLKNIPDTTTSMYQDNRYKEYTKEELIELSKKQ